MSRLDLVVRGAAVGDVQIVKEAERFQGHLVNLAGEAADPGPRGEFVEAAHTVRLAGESDEYRLHEAVSSPPGV
jgi:hypothetical protein